MKNIVERITDSLKYDIQYNDQTGHMNEVLLYDYPEISGGEKSYDETSVAGRKGALVGRDIGKSNLKITCTFSIISPQFMPNVRRLKKWLCGTGQLILSDSPEIYYRVLKVDYGTIERELRNYGRFTATFTCEPFEYLVSGQREYMAEELKFNPYDECCPVYKITGEGMCTLEVNEKQMTANVGQNLTIDTGKMIAYREDGEIRNTDVTGDYEDLFLPEGENRINITYGFDLRIIPNWGYDV